MTRLFSAVAFGVLSLTASAWAVDGGIWKPRLEAVLAKAPKEVADFIWRAKGCQHFAGEEPYDKERADFLNKTMDKLKCNELDAAERMLRKKYAGSPDAQAALDLRDGEVVP